MKGKNDFSNKWASALLSELAAFEMGQAPPGDECNYHGEGTLFVKAGEFGRIHPIEREWTTHPLKFGQKGDVFICVVGATCGKLNLGIDCTIGRSVAAIRPCCALDNRFLYYQLQPLVPRLRASSTGSAQGVLTRKHLSDIRISVAPLNEQRRIVAKIEELFSDLDAGVAALERAKANLKRYRAAVLKAAVDGSLTAEWRAKHPNIEPASKLLERILVERRRKWEADQLAKFKATGKEPPKHWQAKYVEPLPPDRDGLPEIPANWRWVSVEQVSEFVRYGSSARTNANEVGIPVLRMGNIVNGGLDLADLKYLPLDHPEFPLLELGPGDLLFNRTNSAELVGKSAIYDGNPSPCSYASYLISVRCIAGCDSKFLCLYINSAYGRSWIKSVVSQQVGQANVNGTKLQALAFPLPPKEEQIQIAAEVGEKLSQIDLAHTSIEIDLLRASRLRQSILKQAFEGRLVPQDPTDEPAKVLLDRLKADSQPHEANGKPMKTKPRKAKQKTT